MNQVYKIRRESCLILSFDIELYYFYKVIVVYLCVLLFTKAVELSVNATIVGSIPVLLLFINNFSSLPESGEDIEYLNNRSPLPIHLYVGYSPK